MLIDISLIVVYFLIVGELGLYLHVTCTIKTINILCSAYTSFSMLYHPAFFIHWVKE